MSNETDDETLKAEIDEIMNRVDTIMENVARAMPKEAPATEDQHLS